MVTPGTFAQTQPPTLIHSPTLYITSGSAIACHNCPHFVTTAFSLLPVFVCLYVPAIPISFSTCIITASEVRVQVSWSQG